MKKNMDRKTDRWTDFLPCDGYEIAEDGKRPISSIEILTFLRLNKTREEKGEYGFVIIIAE